MTRPSLPNKRGQARKMSSHVVWAPITNQYVCSGEALCTHSCQGPHTGIEYGYYCYDLECPYLVNASKWLNDKGVYRHRGHRP